MKTILSIFLVLSLAAAAALGVRNHSLSRDLDEARVALAELSAAPVVVQAAPVQEWHTSAPTEAEAPADAGVRGAASSPTVVTPAVIPEDVLEKAIAERDEQRRKERDAERERRRQEWENQTPEEREARHQERLQRMQERAAQRLAEFVENTGLNETQCAALEDEITYLDARLRQTAEAWAASIRESGSFGPDARMQLINDLSALVVDSYAGLDESLPANWREADGNFNLAQVVSPEILSPLFEAAREANIHPGAVGSVMGTLMGGFGGMGGRGPRGGNGGQNGGAGGFGPPPGGMGPPPGM